VSSGIFGVSNKPVRDKQTLTDSWAPCKAWVCDGPTAHACRKLTSRHY